MLSVQLAFAETVPALLSVHETMMFPPYAASVGAMKSVATRSGALSAIGTAVTLLLRKLSEACWSRSATNSKYLVPPPVLVASVISAETSYDPPGAIGLLLVRFR